MKINFEDHDLISITTLAGDLNVESVDTFRRGITDRLERGMRDFVLVLNEVVQVDSAGLESLMWMQDRAAERKGQVRLVGVNELIATILRITRLERQFERYEDVTEAVRSLR